MIIECHAHYDDEAFDEDREQLLAGMPEAGIGYIVNVGASLEGTEASVRLAEQYPFVFASVGVHPDETGDLNEENFARLRELCSHPKCVAVGEIGLDYYWNKEAQDIQKKWFVKQLELAKETGLPIIIHSREAAQDTMEIMKEYAQGLPVVIHCYSYSPEMAKEYISMGYYIGIGGVVTFKNAKKIKETVEQIPLDRILLETDSPYLAPVPFRGKRNCSLYLTYVADEIAALKGITAEEVIAQTEKNARAFYRLNEKLAQLEKETV